MIPADASIPAPPPVRKSLASIDTQILPAGVPGHGMTAQIIPTCNRLICGLEIYALSQDAMSELFNVRTDSISKRAKNIMTTII
jgi:hypothetical protein